MYSAVQENILCYLMTTDYTAAHSVKLTMRHFRYSLWNRRAAVPSKIFWDPDFKSPSATSPFFFFSPPPHFYWISQMRYRVAFLIEVCSFCASSVRTRACIISSIGSVFDSSWWEGELHLKVLKQRNNGILHCLWKAIGERRGGVHIKSVSLGSWHDATSQT